MEKFASKYRVMLERREFCMDTLANILVGVLQFLDNYSSGTLERLSRMPRGKRRMVARRRIDLYPGRPDLSDMARRVNAHWYVGTNYSRSDVQDILVYAGVAAGLTSGPIMLESRDDVDFPPLSSLL